MEADFWMVYVVNADDEILDYYGLPITRPNRHRERWALTFAVPHQATAVLIREEPRMPHTTLFGTDGAGASYDFGSDEAFDGESDWDVVALPLVVGASMEWAAG